MLGDKQLSTEQSRSYDQFDRLLDEIMKAEEDLTREIRFFTQRLADTESRIHKSIAELMQIIDRNDINSRAI